MTGELAFAAPKSRALLCGHFRQHDITSVIGARPEMDWGRNPSSKQEPSSATRLNTLRLRERRSSCSCLSSCCSSSCSSPAMYCDCCCCPSSPYSTTSDGGRNPIWIRPGSGPATLTTPAITGSAHTPQVRLQNGMRHRDASSDVRRRCGVLAPTAAGRRLGSPRRQIRVLVVGVLGEPAGKLIVSVVPFSGVPDSVNSPPRALAMVQFGETGSSPFRCKAYEWFEEIGLAFDAAKEFAF